MAATSTNTDGECQSQYSNSLNFKFSIQYNPFIIHNTRYERPLIQPITGNKTCVLLRPSRDHEAVDLCAKLTVLSNGLNIPLTSPQQTFHINDNMIPNSLQIDTITCTPPDNVPIYLIEMIQKYSEIWDKNINTHKYCSDIRQICSPSIEQITNTLMHCIHDKPLIDMYKDICLCYNKLSEDIKKYNVSTNQAKHLLVDNLFNITGEKRKYRRKYRQKYRRSVLLILGEKCENIHTSSPNYEFHLQHTICKDVHGINMKQFILKMMDSIYNNILINIPFYSNENKITQFFLKTRIDGNIDHYIMTNGTPIGFIYCSDGNIEYTTCLELVVNHDKKDFHCYPYYDPIPKSDYKEYIDYHKGQIDNQSLEMFNDIRKNIKNIGYLEKILDDHPPYYIQYFLKSLIETLKKR